MEAIEAICAHAVLDKVGKRNHRNKKRPRARLVCNLSILWALNYAMYAAFDRIACIFPIHHLAPVLHLRSSTWRGGRHWGSFKSYHISASSAEQSPNGMVLGPDIRFPLSPRSILFSLCHRLSQSTSILNSVTVVRSLHPASTAQSIADPFQRHVFPTLQESKTKMR